MLTLKSWYLPGSVGGILTIKNSNEFDSLERPFRVLVTHGAVVGCCVKIHQKSFNVGYQKSDQVFLASYVTASGGKI